MAKSNEIKVKDWYINQTVMPDYRYWQWQEWLDLKRQRNWWFGTRIALVDNTVYYATSSWLVTGNGNWWTTVEITGYVWDTSTPATVVAYSYIDVATVWGSPFICFPVLKWEYYKIDSSTWLANWYFIPTY